MAEQPKNRPNPQEAVAKARAAAAPKVAKAMETAGPAVEKAAAGAGKFLSTLRDRAKDTAKSFSDAYGADDNYHSASDAETAAQPPQQPQQTHQPEAPRRPRPGPGPRTGE
jgi:hypothetical protein